jgi:hypothetical protein
LRAAIPTVQTRRTLCAVALHRKKLSPKTKIVPKKINQALIARA